jgi:hypothetical protein
VPYGQISLHLALPEIEIPVFEPELIAHVVKFLWLP